MCIQRVCLVKHHRKTLKIETIEYVLASLLVRLLIMTLSRFLILVHVVYLQSCAGYSGNCRNALSEVTLEKTAKQQL